METGQNERKTVNGIFNRKDEKEMYTFLYAVPMLSSCSHVGLFETPWTVARQASLSMDFSRQEN